MSFELMLNTINLSATTPVRLARARELITFFFHKYSYFCIPAASQDASESTADVQLEGRENDRVKSTSIRLQEPVKDNEKNQYETDERCGSTQDHGVRFVLLLICLFLGNFLVGYVRQERERRMLSSDPNRDEPR